MAVTLNNKHSNDMEEKMLKILMKYIGNPNAALNARKELLGLFSVSVAKRKICKPCNGTGGNSGLGIAYFKCVHCNGTGLQT